MKPEVVARCTIPNPAFPIILAAAIALSACPVRAGYTRSTCYGTTGEGRLENGVALPSSGSNFTSYTSLGKIFGRTFVHDRVRDIVMSAYRALETSRPGKVYVYGETGKEHGGPFKPHRTHQNGLSVDFMVPVIDSQEHSVPLPASAFNKFGYGIEFDARGRHGNYRIDFEAMAAHLLALKKEGDRGGVGIRRVIFDPQLKPYLYATVSGSLLQESGIPFSVKRSWVRHDEHYHVDFIVPCEEIDSGIE